MGTRFVLIEKIFKEIWKGCLNSTFMPHLSQATICPLNTDFSILLFMQLNALLMSLYPYMYGSWGPRLAGSIQLSSSLAECDPALLSASEIYRGAAGLACGKQMVASCSSSLSSSFLFSLSLIVLLHISADFAKPPPQQKHTSLILSTNPHTCFGPNPTHHSNFSLLTSNSHQHSHLWTL